MTLTELRYIVAVARERHFGRAAEACFVSQPTLSVAIKKLEEELDVKIFERGSNEVSLTTLGSAIVRQAQSVIEQAAAIKEIARRGQDPLSGALKLGIIYTIGPYLLPQLVRHAIELTPQMPLMLRTGELDCAIMAEPFPDSGLAIAPLYDEPFVVAVPRAHALARETAISTERLKQETMLLLGTGHCFRDHVLEVCPEFARFSNDAEGIRKSFEGSSLETIKHMVASGMGVTVVPRLSIAHGMDDPQSHALVTYIPFQAPVPTRRVVLAWRRSFPRYEAIAALRNAVYACALEGVSRLSD
jgi:LysR family hydrogen peroxide-inducible transcriptional activator